MYRVDPHAANQRSIPSLHRSFHCDFNINGRTMRSVSTTQDIAVADTFKAVLWIVSVLNPPFGIRENDCEGDATLTSKKRRAHGSTSSSRVHRASRAAAPSGFAATSQPHAQR